MLFQHMFQQTTHDGATHVGYFNMAVFAVLTSFPSPAIDYHPHTLQQWGKGFHTSTALDVLLYMLENAMLLQTNDVQL